MRLHASATDLVARLLFVLALWGASSAHAQEVDLSVPCAPSITENRRALVQHASDSGMWFHLEVARCMLGRLSALPQYAEQVSILEERLTLSDHRTSLLRRQVAAAEQEAERAVEVLEAAVRGRREAEGRASRERNLRWVWFSVGVVVVVAIEALALWAWSALSD